ncbi:DUF1275 domain-containing protein [Taibaiella sp. KBW10]|uniref:YoaK family protein n=1 Tax=Taibaiella sp. KBW10 TaxID=2153357 RepID=UPI000F5A40CC|nr:YoaK family protein [Taibaiella sp. KBW10]RQO32516.1 DUF1275 domain-containing protein [Taibaiella sp. KBW10]
MLRKYSNSRTLSDNIKLGGLTAFVAGMVNVASFLLFFSFTSNVTGYFAVMIAELIKGNLYQFVIVSLFIASFFVGSFISNFIVIHFNKRNAYLAHAMPIILEMACLLFVGVYGSYYYKDSLIETEVLLMLMLFAMGLQNGLTASISNFAVKTTHLTGATTDLAILFSMFTHKEYRNKQHIKDKAKLLLSIFSAYLLGALVSSLAYSVLKFQVFYVVSLFLLFVIAYDFYKIRSVSFLLKIRKRKTEELQEEQTPLSSVASKEKNIHTGKVLLQ